ncbi:MAG: FAD-dependent monooxygenase [Pseudomonadota bacterium]
MSTSIIIAGGGIVGRTLAVALKTQSHLDVTLLSGPPRPADERASTIAAAARKLYVRVGVWPHLAEAAQPVETMTITDSAPDDTIRPEILTFEGEAGANAFAHVVANAALDAALKARCEALGIRDITERVTLFTEDRDSVTATLSDGSTAQGAILVAADGRSSRLREIAGIATVSHSHHQYGIVGTLTHARPHYGRATQHFLPNGPLALLPLPGEASSMVWTERPSFAQSLVAMDPAMASLEIERVFGLSLGRLCVEPPLQAHPLTTMLARQMASGRLALVGDAAHVIHPLAGQGLNLGLRDVAALAQVLIDAHRNGEDVSLALPRYSKWRRADVTQMALVTDSLNAIFSRRSDLLRAVRSIGLSFVERRDDLKTLFIGEAAGQTGEVPRLMRGEAI